MDYKEIEEIWQAEVAKMAANHSSQMVAMQYNHRLQLKQLSEEIERLNELVPDDEKSKFTRSDNGTN